MTKSESTHFFFFIKIFFFKKNFHALKFLFFLKLFSSVTILKKKNFFFFDIFLKKYFLHKQERNIFLEIKKNNVYLFRNLSLNWFLKSLKKNLSKLKSKQLDSEDLLKLLFSSFIFKDCSIVLNWLKSLLEGLNLKHHRAVLNYFLQVFSNLDNFLLKNFNCLGLKIIINGKIGASGSTKTKSILFKNGKSSLNNKNLKLDFKRIQIKTRSGSLGLKYYIFF